MTDTRLKAEAHRYIEEHKGVSIVELERIVESHMDIEGDQHWCSSKDPNIIFWINCSHEFAHFLSDLFQHPDIEISPTQPLVYYTDGKAPALDVAKRPPKDGYKNPRWLPIQFNPVAE